MSKILKFFPPDGEAVHIGLTSGHLAVVHPEGTDLDARFHKEAIARGCMPAGIGAEAPANTGSFDKKSAIIEAVYKMVDDAREDEFNGDGRPDVRALSKRVGFTVSSGERDEAWEVVSASDKD